MRSELGQKTLDNNRLGSLVRARKVELRSTCCPAVPRAQTPCVPICLRSALGRIPIQLLKLHFMGQTACVFRFMAKLTVVTAFMLWNEWMSKAPWTLRFPYKMSILIWSLKMVIRALTLPYYLAQLFLPVYLCQLLNRVEGVDLK